LNLIKTIKNQLMAILLSSINSETIKTYET
jgi:hypothetical protein